MAIAAPTALIGRMGVLKMMMDVTMTVTRFMVLPMEKVSGEIWSRDM